MVFFGLFIYKDGKDSSAVILFKSIEWELFVIIAGSMLQDKPSAGVE